MPRISQTICAVVALGLITAACGADDSDPATITLITHDSFAISDATMAAFTEETGIVVQQLQSGDAGQLVSEAILTVGNPIGDVLFGIDNTFLQRGLEADLFVAYESEALRSVPDEFELDDQHRVTPIDYGDVCANYWTSAFTDTPAPTTLDDLIDPAFADSFVTQNPETSSPGLAFLLATIARYGDDGWEEYWSALRDNGVLITSGWEDAYYGQFVAGGGERTIVMSYASSPAAEVVFADPPVDTPPTEVLLDGCFRQIEFAGILAGSNNIDAAQQLIDFMLSPSFQEDLPLNMFVYPVNEDAEVPEVFVEHAQLSDDPLVLDWQTIGNNRDAWTDRWVELVLR